MKLTIYDELSEAELSRIEHLAEAATQGPWYSYVAGRDAEAASNYIELGVCNELGSFRSIQLEGATIADQDFIATARQDLPKLLLEVRRLRSCLASLRYPEHEHSPERLSADPTPLPSLHHA